ncbi:hypothetical protein [Enhygromyxa salina]|uniref:Uncharacterized protein n=1 Tax=Enhygromyxa salina TaxID=215803 RepID=A0A2S9XLF2_9BACT|nr:hypothetical protein [Enhygromyxa salina]PRP93511.1 hypothetical protein ENSA7_79390 [Enhygromyxa salina]
MPAHERSLVCVALFGLVFAACVDRAGIDELDELDSGTEETTATATDTGDADTGDTDTDTGDTGDTDGPDTGDTDTGEPLPESFCEQSCAVLSADSCLTEDACLTYCEDESLGWDPAVGQAFAACAATNPLCFQSVEGCMLAELHPPGSPISIRIDGAGFDAHEGMPIRVWGDPDVDPQFAGEATVVDGAFSFAWAEPVQIFDVFGPLLLAYIDVDDDGSCDGDIDVAASLNTAWNGDLLDPVFEVSMVAPLDPAAFVCDFVP